MFSGLFSQFQYLAHEGVYVTLYIFCFTYTVQLTGLVPYYLIWGNDIILQKPKYILKSKHE